MADAIASTAELVLGQVGGVPAVLVRGLVFATGDGGAVSGLIPSSRDLFRDKRSRVRLGCRHD